MPSDAAALLGIVGGLIGVAIMWFASEPIIRLGARTQAIICLALFFLSGIKLVGFISVGTIGFVLARQRREIWSRVLKELRK